MKRILSFVLVTTMLLSISIGTVFAKDNYDKQQEELINNYEEFFKNKDKIDSKFLKNIDNEKKGIRKVIEINEYDYIKTLKVKSDEELINLGLDSEEIEKIRDLDYKQELFKRKELKKEALEQLGYSDEQINMLESFQGTEAEIMSLSGTFVAYEDFHYFSYDSAQNRTKMLVYFIFSWDVLPLLCFQDIMGVSWTEDFLVDGYTDVLLKYHKEIENETEYVFQEPVFEGVTALSSKFYLAPGYGDYVDKTLQGGQFTVKLYKQGRVENIAVLWKYGHATVGITPGFSLAKDGFNFSLVPQIYNDELDQIYVPKTLQQ